MTTVTRYEQSLVGFERVSLKPGESTVVSFDLGPESFGYWAAPGTFVVPVGEYELQLGHNCADTPLKAKVKLP